MAIHFSCPHCHSTLRIPEECGGQTAKCPSCLVDFVIPGSSHDTSTVPICAVVVSTTPKYSEADVRRAQRAAEQLAAEDLGFHIRVTHAKRQWQRLAKRLSTLQSFHSGREALDHTVGRVGGFFLTITLGAAILVLAASFFSPSGLAYLLVAAIGVLTTALIYLPFSVFPEDKQLASMISDLSSRFEHETIEYHKLLAEADQLHQRLTIAEADFQRLKTEIDSRLHWLRNCQWQAMSGKSFENFLAQVFEEHGYAVEVTGKSGDQGVDLIVAHSGSRVAVQAKGCVGTNVGNAAVQQVHAGMGFYGCDSAVVITTSQFTPSARELAERLNCKLIDSSQLPALIDGGIAF